VEKRSLVLALALTLPLALYGIPYAAASTFSSTYVVTATNTVAVGSQIDQSVHCNSGDYATGGGVNPQEGGAVVSRSYPLFFDGASYNLVGANQPNAWTGEVVSIAGTQDAFGIQTYVVCQTPITVAGIGVPEFGSLYVAIALGAVLYFMLSRRFTRRPAISIASEAKA
jgi:hypothetical protein